MKSIRRVFFEAALTKPPEGKEPNMEKFWLEVWTVGPLTKEGPPMMTQAVEQKMNDLCHEVNQKVLPEDVPFFKNGVGASAENLCMFFVKPIVNRFPGCVGQIRVNQGTQIAAAWLAGDPVYVE